MGRLTLGWEWEEMGLSWLPGLGSNQGLQLQRLTCYHYTTGQSAGQPEQLDWQAFKQKIKPECLNILTPGNLLVK